ncbi:MAG: nucleotide exchange factor GrpE [Candidatus Sericytochromatia bacterium]|nr:nucleotide exchange factor GrpE [Candidatus Sericytochromatia bacterium]
MNVDEIPAPDTTAPSPQEGSETRPASSQAAEAATASDPSPLLARVAELEAQLAARDEAFLELKSHATRLAADFENSRQRWTREKSELIKSAGERVVEQFLDVLDNFERAIQIGERATEPQQVLTGVQMIYKQVLDFLAKEGVAPMNAAGKPFDPNHHEAVVQEESEEHPDQTVLDEFRKGYLLNGRVLRHALVKIASNPSVPFLPAAAAEGAPEQSPPSEPAAPDSAS